MSASTIIEEMEHTNFINSPMDKKILLPGNNRKKHILDSFNIRRDSSTKCRQVSIPEEQKYVDSKLAFANSKQVEEKTNKTLDQKRKNLINTVRETTAKWNDLENNEEKLKTCFVHFNNFVIGNGDRRNRHLLRRQHKHDDVKRYSNQIEILKLELERCKIIQLLLRMETDKHSMYYHYLQNVVDHSEHRFLNIRDLMKTFEFIFDSLERMTGSYKDAMLQLEKLKNITVGTKPELVELHSKIYHLSKTYDDVRLRNSENEKLILSVCSKIYESTMEYEDCLRNISDLYTLICGRLEVREVFSKGDYMSQMFFIKYVLGVHCQHDENTSWDSE